MIYRAFWIVLGNDKYFSQNTPCSYLRLLLTASSLHFFVICEGTFIKILWKIFWKILFFCSWLNLEEVTKFVMWAYTCKDTFPHHKLFYFWLVLLVWVIGLSCQIITLLLHIFDWPAAIHWAWISAVPLRRSASKRELREGGRLLGLLSGQYIAWRKVKAKYLSHLWVLNYHYNM